MASKCEEEKEKDLLGYGQMNNWIKWDFYSVCYEVKGKICGNFNIINLIITFLIYKNNQFLYWLRENFSLTR